MVEAVQAEDTPMVDDTEVQAKTEDTEKVPDIKDDSEQGAPRENSEGAIKGEEDKEDEVHGVPLEELFADDVDDMGIDQFPNGDSQATDGSQMNGRAEESPAPSAAPQVTSEMMFAFYQRLFPFNTLFQWLNHGVKSSPDFGNREFAFTLQNDAYLRYQSFLTADSLRKDILRLNPSRFEIGPVYSTNPRDRKSLRKASSFRPISKELVFDIDLTDYDDIRTCCTKANICHKCWTFVTMAIRVVDAALREDFGFEHILWVYSGRRGAHAWVCDRRARDMPDDRRRAIAVYLELLKGGQQSGRRVTVKRPLHPHVARSLEILKPYFASTTLKTQDTFSNAEQAERLLKLLPDQALANALRKKWDQESSDKASSKRRWADIDEVAKTMLARGGSKSANADARALLEAKQEIVLEYTYPRLDAEVSKKLIHLLKSPFVVHPGTGRVCVPIDVRRLDQFDPLSVPKVGELIVEINDYDASHQNGGEDGGDENVNGDSQSRKIQDYEKTSLKPYVDYFRTFVAGLLKNERDLKRARGEVDDEGTGDAMEF